MALGKTIFIKKLTDGRVSLLLQDVDGVLPSRWFYLDEKMPKVGVPTNYALSYFFDSSFELMVKKGYIEFENMAELVKMAEEREYIAPSVEEKQALVASKRTNETLYAIIKGGNVDKLKELFASADKERAYDIAKNKVNELTRDVIIKIEDILGVALVEE